MMALREAAEQALEAMIKASGWMSDADYKKLNESIEVLSAALAEDALERMSEDERKLGIQIQPVQEPVAKVELMTTGGNAGLATRIVEIDDHLRDRLRPGQLLYTTPLQRQPLTDDEIDKLPRGPHEGNPVTFAEGLRDIARAIERAHGIGGNT